MAGTSLKANPQPAKSSTAQPGNAASQQQQSNGNGPKVVGPNIKGQREEYQLVMHLQSALFGGVYEAKGLSSKRDFAIKVLHKSELQKAQETSSIEFCEVPLSEIKFANVMRGHEHVMEAEEHFEDQYCHYCVFELCRGGDLLEALKQKPTGFDEAQAQFLIKQAAEGLAFLHKRGVAMQDVSLENMLLHVNEKTGHWQVKICDPGQAVHFETDSMNQEMHVGFRGLVGKSFRPPELHEQKAYSATKVDSWCLGWSTFYLLTAQPLFMSADPAQKDADWLLFQNGEFDKLFQTKNPVCSGAGIDFIFRLLQLDPDKRMSIADAVNHSWLCDPKVPPVLAPKELLPEALRESEQQKAAQEAAVNRNSHMALPKQTSLEHLASNQPVSQGGSLSAAPVMASGGMPAQNISPLRAAHVGNEGLPTWASAPMNLQLGQRGVISGGANPLTPMMRVRSPMRSPRTSGTTIQQLPVDRRSRRVQPHPGSAARSPYVVATAHSPAPTGASTSQQYTNQRGSAGARAASPMQSSPDKNLVQNPSGSMLPAMTQQTPQWSEAQNYLTQIEGVSTRASFLSTSRSSSRPRVSAAPAVNMVAGAPAKDTQERGRAWAFGGRDAVQLGELQKRMGSDTTTDIPGRGRAVSPVPLQAMQNTGYVSNVAGQRVQSPARTVYVSRSPSPVQHHQQQVDLQQAGFARQVRGSSPGASVRGVAGSVGFSWAQAAFSPRVGTAAHRTTSPSGVNYMSANPASVYAWSPDPPAVHDGSLRSPHASPRAFSPAPPISFAQAPSMMVPGLRR
eukprot:TRINITY_DN36585_c0_g1_i1.p1 TRINITY_DN36585_c0_g1~~TRINITY_DN36585_c0_g1_i1.p1  ORF type:complete len:791 (-),score=157.32 TRINITY_DN36585_c0_g1_i1:188-2560(-)